MNLSPHFTLSEMLASDTATRLSIDEQFNPSAEVVGNLTALCNFVLEPLRAELNAPIRISSGYRCEMLNKIIGGAVNSQHVYGEAVDFSVDGFATEMLYQYIKASSLDFSQLIQEFDRWVHISFSSSENPPRRSCLRATKVNGQTLYAPDNRIV